MNLNKNASKLKVGMRVISDFHADESEIVRTITMITKSNDFGSKYVASADGGDSCPCCGAIKGTPISHVDAVWFIQV